MELRQIKCFLAVAEFLSFRAAAARLGLRQPSVSQRIHVLEDELGVTLFERHAGRGVRLTDAGSQFLRDARRVVADTDRAFENARRAGRGEVGEFALGFMTSLAYPALQLALRRYRAAAPDVEITLVEGNTADLEAATLDHRIDLGVVADGVSSRRIERVSLWSERLYVAVPEGNALAHAEKIDWTMLADVPLLVRASENSAPGYEFLLKRLSSGRRVEIHRHLVGRDNLVALAAAGFGVAVLVEPLPCLNHPSVVLKPIEDEDAVIQVSAIWLADSENPAVGRFLSLLRESAALVSPMIQSAMIRPPGPSEREQTSDPTP